ncbi:MAG: phosphohistidine phosphatase SixA [Candidatus Bathyarchaeia archaeon]
MKLYLVQHAEAKKEDEDPARPISEKGWKDLEKISNFLKNKGIKLTKILHSGKLRAKQTAEKLSEVVHSIEGVKEVNSLAPLDDPFIWKGKLKVETNDLMLVGHLPHLNKLASFLLVGNIDQKIINFKMGGVVCLEKDEKGVWSIDWIIVPEIL